MKLSVLLLMLPVILSGTDYGTLRKRYDQPRLFLHERVNYYFCSDNDFIWNQNRFRDSGLRLSYGSIGKTDLLRNEELLINHKLSGRLRFRGEYRVYEGRIFTERTEIRFFKFYLKTFYNFYAGAIVSPYSEKDDIDVGAGILWLSENEEEFLSIDLINEDNYYDERNRVDGKQTTDPFKVLWSVRKKFGRLTSFSGGSFGEKFVREFKYPGQNDRGLSHEKNKNYFDISLDFEFDRRNSSTINALYYDFFEKEIMPEDADSYEFSNRIFEYGIRHGFRLYESIVISGGIRHIVIIADHDAVNAYRVRREEIMPEFRFKYRRGIIEYGASYFSSLLSVNGDRSYEDKVEASAEVFFSGNSRLKFSLSHVTTINGFGGGNVQYTMNF